MVEGGSGRRFCYARLPFGWSCSPATCRRLVLAVVHRVLWRRGISGWVYLDDTLLSARRKRRLRRAVKECARLLKRAGFIVGAKSEVTPTESISFIGKNLDTRTGTISNAVGALVGAFRSWVRGVGRGQLPTSAMERLLGKLCWLGRPNAGLWAFLTGAYSGLHRGLGLFGRGVAKGIAIVQLFSCVPQTTNPLGRCDAAPWEVFTYAAPEGSGFRVGIVGERGSYRSVRCLPWVNSLQQAEMFAVYVVAKLASYRGCESVRIGSDNDVARSQVNALRASVGSVNQQQILRRLFWLRCWTSTSISSLRVSSALNPADPLSRETCFQSRRQAVKVAEWRRRMWAQAADERYNGLAEMIPPPWRFRNSAGGKGGTGERAAGHGRADARRECAVCGK